MADRLAQAMLERLDHPVPRLGIVDLRIGRIDILGQLGFLDRPLDAVLIGRLDHVAVDPQLGLVSRGWREAGALTFPLGIVDRPLEQRRENLTISLAGQYGKHGISFCAVNPGPVRTERWAGLVDAMARDMKISREEADTLAPSSIPLGRIAEVEEVANLVVMLASPLMHMVNGTMIEIDGGQDKPLMDRFRDRPRG